MTKQVASRGKRESSSIKEVTVARQSVSGVDIGMMRSKPGLLRRRIIEGRYLGKQSSGLAEHIRNKDVDTAYLKW